MKTFNKSMISLALLVAVATPGFAATPSTAPKLARADFSNKLLLIPCVEVTKTPFDGYYNVLMSLSGDGSGLDWKVKEAKKAAAGECDDDGAPSTSSTDDLLKSMGMPTIAEMTNKKPDEADDKDDEQPSQNNSAITDSINNNINNAINSAIK